MAIKPITTKQMLQHVKSPTVDQVGIVERAARYTTRSIKKEAKEHGEALPRN